MRECGFCLKEVADSSKQSCRQSCAAFSLVCTAYLLLLQNVHNVNVFPLVQGLPGEKGDLGMKGEVGRMGMPGKTVRLS